MRTSAFFGAKNFGFFKIYRVSARTRGEFEPVRTFCRLGEVGSIFRDFVRMSFMDCPLLRLENNYTEINIDFRFKN